MLGFFDHGLFELAAVAVAFLIGRRFILHRPIAVAVGGISLILPLVLFFLATSEVQTWLLAGILVSAALNVTLVVELASGRSFRASRQRSLSDPAVDFHTDN